MGRLKTALAALAVAGLCSAGGVRLVSLGTHVYGPRLTMEDLKGHVFIAEKWGIN